jgi:hypothetical protein
MSPAAVMIAARFSITGAGPVNRAIAAVNLSDIGDVAACVVGRTLTLIAGSVVGPLAAVSSAVAPPVAAATPSCTSCWTSNWTVAPELFTDDCWLEFAAAPLMSLRASL